MRTLSTWAFSVLLLLARISFTASVSAQAPSIAPGRVFVEPTSSTSYSENVANIHWRKGNGKNYVVLIRQVEPYSGAPAPALVLPDNRPYATNGNYRMDANSLAPQNPAYPNIIAPTYLLRTGAYSSAADTTASVQNAQIGMYYEVTVFEYNPDPTGGGNYYSFSKPTTFNQPRITPRVTRTTLDEFKRPIVNFTVPAEFITSYFYVEYATDSTQLSGAIKVQVAPAITNTNGQVYSAKLPIFYSGGPLYVRIELVANYRPLLAEKRISKAVLFTSVFTSFLAVPTSSSTSNLKLDWSVVAERNNVGFQIQRSLDSLAWTQVAMVPSRGDSPFEEFYSYSVAAGPTSYYRILQIGQGAAITGISPLRRIVATPLAAATAAATVAFSAYPNPASTQVHLAAPDRDHPVELLNSLGQLVRQQQPGQALLLVQDLPRGLYVLRQGSRSTRLTLE